MPKKKDPRLALLRQIGRFSKRNLAEAMHNTLENGLLFILHFRSGRACFAERESALELGFKTAGMG